MKTIYLSVILSILSVQKCSKNPSQKNTLHLNLLNASYTEWTSGVKGGGKGREYYLKIELLSDSITVDSLWINRKMIKAFIPQSGGIRSGNSETANYKYQRGDTLTVRASESSRMNDNSPAPPINNFNGAAILKYSIGDNTFYIPIDSLVKIPNQNRP
jgi:hypothetical protein|tara:strand:+ start:194 stop:667 length:474 start_codon:yes stop_codon:yes gene_type:complete